MLLREATLLIGTYGVIRPHRTRRHMLRSAFTNAALQRMPSSQSLRLSSEAIQCLYVSSSLRVFEQAKGCVKAMSESERSSRLTFRLERRRVVAALPFAASIQKALANLVIEFADASSKKAAF
jgi:hypothetical protein